MLAHSGQRRSGSASTPRIAHLLGVASIAIDYGADEDEAIGALLHEACEGEDGLARLEEIRNKFGLSVAGIVQGCTDPEGGRASWREWKQQRLASLADASPSVRFVTAADKLDDVRFILGRFYAREPIDSWALRWGGRGATLWYLRAVAQTLRKALPAPEPFKKPERHGVVAELERMVTDIEEFNRLDEIAEREAKARRPHVSERTLDVLLEWLNRERTCIDLPPCCFVSPNMGEDDQREQMEMLLNELGKYRVDLLNRESADPEGDPVTVLIDSLASNDGHSGVFPVKDD